MTGFMKCALGAALSIVAVSPSFATDFSDGDIHKNDYKWLQFNLMRSENARIPYGAQDDTYVEMEFGGRSGMWDLYGYVDWFDALDSSSDDRHNSDNMFAKIAPRLSLDALTKKDLSFGPVKELYIASVTNVGDNALFEHYIGLGSDIQVPWFGKVGLNLYARYVRENYGAHNEGKFDGYMISTNWFKPFKEFENGSFLSYQGYLDYKFGADELKHDAADAGAHASNAMEWFNGLYWHSKRYAVGYGLKYFHNMALVKDDYPVSFLKDGKQDTSGIGHYFSVTYKF